MHTTSWRAVRQGLLASTRGQDELAACSLGSQSSSKTPSKAPRSLHLGRNEDTTLSRPAICRRAAVDFGVHAPGSASSESRSRENALGFGPGEGVEKQLLRCCMGLLHTGV